MIETCLMPEVLVTQFNTTSTVYNPGGGPFKMEVPQSSVSVLRPVSYKFRVAEHVDDKGNVQKVGLQVQVWEHTNYGGAGTMKHDWMDVERVQLPFVE